MIAGQNGDRNGAARPLWIAGLSPPDSWRSLRQPGYPQLHRARHPQHRVWGYDCKSGVSDFRLSKVCSFRLPLTIRVYNHRGTAEQCIKEGKKAIKWTQQSCSKFRNNEVRLQLHALAYNLGNFMRTLALPKEVGHRSLTTLREKLVRSGPSLFAMADNSRPNWPK